MLYLVLYAFNLSSGMLSSFAQTCVVGSMVDCHDHHDFNHSFVIERNVAVIW